MSKINRKGYKYRLYPTKEQGKLLEDYCWKNNILYNKFVEADEKHRAWSICEEIEKNPDCPFNPPFINENGKIFISYKDGKKPDKYKFPYKNYIPSHPFCKQDKGKIVYYEGVKFFRKDEFFFTCPANYYNTTAVENYEVARKNAMKFGFGFPKYKKTRGKYKLTVIPKEEDNKYFNWEQKTIQVSSGDRKNPLQISFRGHKKPRGVVRNGTISQTPDGKWWISIMAEWSSKQETHHKNPEVSIGIDVGISTSITTSKGNLLSFPQKDKIEKMEDRIKRLQQIKSRKYQKNGKIVSNSQKIIQNKINKIQGKISFIKQDWKNKTVLILCRENGIIYREDLSLSNMSSSAKGTEEKPGRNVRQKAGLNKNLLKEGHFDTFTKLINKQNAFGGLVFKVPPAYTSQDCSICGHRSADNRKEKVFLCVSCGHKEDADINAAKNILKKGLDGERIPC